MKHRINTILLSFFLIFTISCGGKKPVVIIEPSQPLNEYSLDNLTLKVYLENSGSMDGYMEPKSTLRSDVYSFVSAISSKSKDTHLYYINSKLIPRRDNIQDFFQDLNKTNFRNAGGNRAHSELSDMFDMILKNTNDSTVSVFVSDCILDPNANMPSYYFAMRQTSLRESFRQHIATNSNFGAIVIRLDSYFDGKLFPSGMSPITYKGNRPYYIWVLGNANLLAAINKNVNPSYYIRSSITDYLSFASVPSISYQLISTEGIVSRRDPNKLVLNKEINNRLYFKIQADLRSLLLQDADNEVAISNANLKIASVEKIKLVNGHKNPYSTSFTLETLKTAKGQYILSFPLQTLPEWVDTKSDNIGDNELTTCGLSYIINGIYEAFAEAHRPSIKFQITRE